MAFELEHDWQANLATPRARIGERAKTRLLIVLCTLWICLGLVGHQPWKPDEAQTISIVSAILHGSSIVSPVVVGQATIENPPLYYLTAAGLAKLVMPLLSMHDAARLASGVWMAITLLMVGMIGREFWGVGAGRQTTFIFISSIGLVVTAHLLMEEVAALTGTAMGLYALALSNRRPFRASALLGTAIGISFLSTGILPASLLVVTMLLMPLLFSPWRTSRYAIVVTLSVITALPWLVIWPLVCWQATPELFMAWWQASITPFFSDNHFYAIVYFLDTLSWFAWPALPIAVWGLWVYRRYLLVKPKFQLLIGFFIVSLLLTAAAADARDIYALPLLLPLAVLAGGSVETLKRGAAGLLNWFGILLFGVIGFLIWLGWLAMTTGWPAKLSVRMHILSGVTNVHFSWLGLTAAVTASLIWLLVINNAKHSNRATVTDWAVGMTAAWTLLMSLWLPWIDTAKSYQAIMHQLKKAMPEQYACVTSRNMGEAQMALLDYYTGIRTQQFVLRQRLDCDLYLIQDDRDREKIEPGPDWKLLWKGRRPADRRESFRLYQHL